MQDQGEVGGEVVDRVVGGEQVDDAVDVRSGQRQADPDPDDSPEYLWSCMEGDTYGSPHALASHSGKAKGKQLDHSPLGMVDTSTGQVVWRWTTPKAAYGLYKRLKDGVTLTQALSEVAPASDGTDNSLIRYDDSLTSTTRNSAATRSPVGKSNSVADDVGTVEDSDHKLGGVLRPEVWWLNPKLKSYYDMVKNGLALQGMEYTDSFSQFIYNAVVGYLMEHGSELGIGAKFTSETESII